MAGSVMPGATRQAGNPLDLDQLSVVAQRGDTQQCAGRPTRGQTSGDNVPDRDQVASIADDIDGGLHQILEAGPEPGQGQGEIVEGHGRLGLRIADPDDLPVGIERTCSGGEEDRSASHDRSVFVGCVLKESINGWRFVSHPSILPRRRGPLPSRTGPGSLKEHLDPDDKTDMATLTEKPTRRKRKNLAKAQKIIGPSTLVAAYGSGAGKARITRGFIILVSSYVAISLAVFVLAGIVLIPGLVVIIIGASLLRPRRGIAVTSSGLIILHESMLDASPNRVILSAPLASLSTTIRDGQGSVQTSVDLEMGAERIRLKRATFETLLLASRGFPGPDPYSRPGPASLPGPAWFADPTGRNEYRYWDGSAWTNHVSTGGTVLTEPG